MYLNVYIYAYLNETNIMANMRYLPRRGTTREVGGMISTTSRKNTYRLVRIEMDRVTCKYVQIYNMC